MLNILKIVLRKLGLMKTQTPVIPFCVLMGNSEPDAGQVNDLLAQINDEIAIEERIKARNAAEFEKLARRLAALKSTNSSA
jgi:hypothetical protein